MAIFLKSSALNDDVFGKSQDPIKKFIMDTESAAKKEHSVLEAIFSMQSADSFASKFSSFTQRGLFSDVGSQLICSH